MPLIFILVLLMVFILVLFYLVSQAASRNLETGTRFLSSDGGRAVLTTLAL